MSHNDYAKNGQFSYYQQMMDVFFERSPLNMMIIGEQLEIVCVNQAFCSVFAYTDAALNKKLFSDICTDISRQAIELFLKQLSSDNTPKELVCKCIDEKGNIIDTTIGFNVLNHSDDNTVRFVLTFHIEKTKRMEAELKEKNLQLQKYIDSNLQLENFAYIASHDMKEPLRMIGNFSQLLRRRHLDKLDAEGKEFVHYIFEGAKNMNRLINDILSYSRVNTDEYTYDRIHLMDFIYNILHNLKASILENKGEIIVGEQMPEYIVANKTTYSQLFQNLISNALKFHQKGKAPLIKIEAEERGNSYLFSISDNGIGIAPEYHERIFILFKKLHNKVEYTGTGIGLALCKKIVEKHSGEMWVESEPGQGATFYFTLPRLNITQ